MEWDALRSDSADLIGLIRGKLANDAPGTAAVLGAAEGLAGGDLDAAIAAGFDLLGEIRDRRRATKEAAETQPTDEAKTQSKRPVRDALFDLLRRKKE